jgi:hypothetical protein
MHLTHDVLEKLVVVQLLQGLGTRNFVISRTLDPASSLYAVFVLVISHTVDSRLSARGLTALRLNRGNVFLKKKIVFSVSITFV